MEAADGVGRSDGPPEDPRINQWTVGSLDSDDGRNRIEFNHTLLLPQFGLG